MELLGLPDDKICEILEYIHEPQDVESILNLGDEKLAALAKRCIAEISSSDPNIIVRADFILNFKWLKVVKTQIKIKTELELSKLISLRRLCHAIFNLVSLDLNLTELLNKISSSIDLFLEVNPSRYNCSLTFKTETFIISVGPHELILHHIPRTALEKTDTITFINFIFDYHQHFDLPKFDLKWLTYIGDLNVDDNAERLVEELQQIKSIQHLKMYEFNEIEIYFVNQLRDQIKILSGGILMNQFENFEVNSNLNILDIVINFDVIPFALEKFPNVESIAILGYDWAVDEFGRITPGNPMPMEILEDLSSNPQIKSVTIFTIFPESIPYNPKFHIRTEVMY